MLIVVILLLAAGTYAFRLGGVVLRDRIPLPAPGARLLPLAAIALLAALAATAALTQGHGFAGVARPAGVVTGGLLAARGAPFFAVVLAAAACTALLRWLHIP